MTYGWDRRPAKAEVKHYESQGPEGPRTAVYSVGRWLVRVPLPEGQREAPEVSYERPHYSTKGGLDVEVEDGEIRIQLTDLVGEVLARVGPSEIAATLWANEEVRAAFLAKCAARWSTDFTDEDRRRLLLELREQIHDKRLEAVKNWLGEAEHAENKRRHFSEEVRRINATLRDLNVRVKVYRATSEEMELLQFDEGTGSRKHPETGEAMPGPFEIARGESWKDAREFWRAELLKRFPPPGERDAIALDALREADQALDFCGGVNEVPSYMIADARARVGEALQALSPSPPPKPEDDEVVF